MTGRLTVRNGVFYAVISYKDEFSNYKQKWINTQLKERGNKKEAQRFLEEQLENFGKETEEKSIENYLPESFDKDTTFSDYIAKYSRGKKRELGPIVYDTNLKLTDKIIEFFGKKIKLKDVTYHHILSFQDYLKNERNLKNRSIKNYYEILSPALRIAYRDNLIPKNPFEFMPRLVKEKHISNYYNSEELEKLFEFSKLTKIDLIVKVAAFYGFRRSEILGLKWSAVDFDKKTITMNHTVQMLRGKVIKSNKTKTQASTRTLPLLPNIEKLLLERKSQNEKNQKLFGKSYSQENLDYIFLNECGEIIKSNYVTNVFVKIIKNNDLKKIRFHDLRHSCASLLLKNNIPMKHIQEWLGHANFNTTADVYSHLDFSSKIISANVITDNLVKNDYDKSIKDTYNEIEELKKQLLEKEEYIKKKKQKDDEMC